MRAAVYAGLGPAARSHDHARAARLLDDGGRLARARRGAAPALPARRRRVGVRAARRRRAAGVGARRGGRGGHLPAARARRAARRPSAGPSSCSSSAPRSRRSRSRGGGRPPARGARRRARRRAALPRDDAARRRARPDRHARRRRSTCSRSSSTRSPTAPTCAAQTEAALTNVTRIDPATRPRAAGAIESMRRRVEGGDERDPAVLGTIAAEMGMAGDPVDADGADRRARGRGLRRHGDHRRGMVLVQRRPLAGRGRALRRGAARASTVALERARERGAVLDVGAVLTFRGELYLHVGDLAERRGRRAHAAARSRTCAAGRSEPGSRPPGSARCWSSAASSRRPKRCSRRARSPDRRPRSRTSTRASGCCSRAARLRLAQGRLDEAVEDLRECGAARGRDRPRQPRRRAVALAAGPRAGRARPDRARRDGWRPRSSSALARCGARRAIGIALRAAARVERRRVAPAARGGRGPRRLAGAARARAGARRARRRPAARRRPPRTRASRCASRSTSPTAAAPTRSRTRRSPSCARPARGRAGASTTGAGALTPSERRIAELAAAGQQNREIAEALFVTTHTVEFHLRNAYRKLGIASRTELAGALAG